MRIRKSLIVIHSCNRILGTVFRNCIGDFVKEIYPWRFRFMKFEFAVRARSLIFSARQGTNEDSRDTYIEKRLSLVQILSVWDRIACRVSCSPVSAARFSLSSSFTIFNDTCTWTLIDDANCAWINVDNISTLR